MVRLSYIHPGQQGARWACSSGWFGSMRCDAEQLGRTTAESRPRDLEKACPARGAAALRIADLGWQGRPRRLPPPSEPRHDNRLVRGSPGGVWARDIPLYRRAVPGQRSSTRAPNLFKPCARRWSSLPRQAAPGIHGAMRCCAAPEDSMMPTRRPRSWCDLIPYQGSAPSLVSLGSHRRPARSIYRWRPLRTALIRWRVD
jgi:hypothetical protein